MEQKKVEQRTLIIGTILNTIMAAAGWWVYQATKIEALFLDANFSLISALSCVAAILISKNSKKTSKTFPHGHFLFEPLYAILKSLFIFGLLISATISSAIKAIDYFQYGAGEKIIIGPVIPYEIVMVILCFGLSLYSRYKNKSINNVSTMLDAEAKSNFVDGILSAGIGIGAVIIALIDETDPFSFLLYTGDIIITMILVLCSVKKPVQLLKEGFIELSYGVLTDEAITQPIKKVIQQYVPTGTELSNCNIRKIGTSFRVSIYLSYQTESVCVKELSEKKACIEKELSSRYSNLNVNFILP